MSTAHIQQDPARDTPVDTSTEDAHRLIQELREATRQSLAVYIEEFTGYWTREFERERPTHAGKRAS